MSNSGRTYQSQTVTVEGSRSGAVNPISKFSYNCLGFAEYIGECEIATVDTAQAHYIEKYVYDCAGNLERILIATNLTECEATEIVVREITPELLEVEILNVEGDFSEVKTGDSFNLNTDNQNIIGAEVGDKISDKIIRVKLNEDNTFTPLAFEAISEDQLTIRLVPPKNRNANDDQDSFNRRRWDHRTRYRYK